MKVNKKGIFAAAAVLLLAAALFVGAAGAATESVNEAKVVHSDGSGQEYATLAAAIAAAEATDTVKLLKDVTLDSKISISKDLTIDGAKNATERYTITTSSTYTFVLDSEAGHKFTLKNLDLKASDISTCIKLPTNNNGAELTLTNVHIDGYGFGMYLEPPSTASDTLSLSIDRCEFKNIKWMAIDVLGLQSDGSVIKNSTFTNCGSNIAGAGSYGGCAINIMDHNSSITAGDTLTIENCTFTNCGYGDSFDNVDQKKGGCAVRITAESQTENVTTNVASVVIKKCDFTNCGSNPGNVTEGKEAAPIKVAARNEAASTKQAYIDSVEISNCTFTTCAGYNNKEIILGENNAAASKLQKSPYTVTIEGKTSGWTNVADFRLPMVAKITKGAVTTYYATLADAVAAAADGDTIELLKNVDMTAQLTITGKTITIDGDSKTLTVKHLDTTTTGGAAVLIDGTGAVTLKDLTIVGPNESAPTKWADYRVAVKVYGGTNVFENVTIKNGNEAIQVSGSGTQLTLQGDANVFDGNFYNGIEVKNGGKLVLAEGVDVNVPNPANTGDRDVEGHHSYIWNDTGAATVTGAAAVVKAHPTVSTKNYWVINGDAEAEIDGVKYATLALAIEKAASGKTVTLLKNVDMTESTTIPTGVILTIPKGVTLNTGSYKVDIIGELVVEGKFTGKIASLSADTLVITKGGQVIASFPSIDAILQGIELEANAVLTISNGDPATIDQVLAKVKTAEKGALIIDAGAGTEKNAVTFTEDYDGSSEEEPKVLPISVDPDVPPVGPTEGTTIVGLGVDVQYEFTIPMAVALNSSAAVSYDYSITMTLPAGTGSEKVVMKLDESANSFKVKDSASPANYVAYTAKLGSESGTPVVEDSTIVSCPVTTTSGSPVTEQVFFKLTDNIPFAGSYQDTLTFSVAVK